MYGAHISFPRKNLKYDQPSVGDEVEFKITQAATGPTGRDVYLITRNKNKVVQGLHGAYSGYFEPSQPTAQPGYGGMFGAGVPLDGGYKVSHDHAANWATAGSHHAVYSGHGGQHMGTPHWPMAGAYPAYPGYAAPPQQQFANQGPYSDNQFAAYPWYSGMSYGNSSHWMAASAYASYPWYSNPSQAALGTENSTHGSVAHAVSAGANALSVPPVPPTVTPAGQFQPSGVLSSGGSEHGAVANANGLRVPPPPPPWPPAAGGYGATWPPPPPPPLEVKRSVTSGDDIPGNDANGSAAGTYGAKEPPPPPPWPPVAKLQPESTELPAGHSGTHGNGAHVMDVGGNGRKLPPPPPPWPPPGDVQPSAKNGNGSLDTGYARPIQPGMPVDDRSQFDGSKETLGDLGRKRNLPSVSAAPDGEPDPGRHGGRDGSGITMADLQGVESYKDADHGAQQGYPVTKRRALSPGCCEAGSLSKSLVAQMPLVSANVMCIPAAAFAGIIVARSACFAVPSSHCSDLIPGRRPLLAV
eukprot:gnl/TRDRNA2_/TRDRNA2_160305_c1_seq1.p1 gnl/TRDRNA2_/TRDRNA2_160305_c1~~gnl/TRDRNA2_/TRDRNA2_160305_c1_seq1.p1  ORF type:complete len:559 (+),score=72.84 gnl/TRDRNA2_/TRDRNA2_160305_c1_seq1:102-1679(+)